MRRVPPFPIALNGYPVTIILPPIRHSAIHRQIFEDQRILVIGHRPMAYHQRVAHGHAGRVVGGNPGYIPRYQMFHTRATTEENGIGSGFAHERDAATGNGQRGMGIRNASHKTFGIQDLRRSDQIGSCGNTNDYVSRFVARDQPGCCLDRGLESRSIISTHDTNGTHSPTTGNGKA